MPDIGNVKDCLELPPTNFSLLTLDLTNLLISFTVLYCFLFRFVCIRPFSLIWFLQIWVAIYVYGAMINYWFTLIKKLMQNVYRHSLWEYSKRFHCSFQWHLTPHMTLTIQPVLGGHPVLSGHYSIPRGCPLNTGFIVATCIKLILTL